MITCNNCGHTILSSSWDEHQKECTPENPMVLPSEKIIETAISETAGLIAEIPFSVKSGAVELQLLKNQIIILKTLKELKK